MTPEARQSRLVQELLQFEDAHERLAFVQDRVRRQPALADEFLTEAYRIQGCATRVWLVGSLSNGVCNFQVDSESAIVKGMASLIAEVYSGSPPSAVLAFRCSILGEAGLQKRITPTRLHGLAQLEAAIHAFARAHASHHSKPPCA